MKTINEMAKDLEAVRGEIKQQLNTYSDTAKKLEEIEEKQNLDPENEDLEAEWLREYEKHFNSYIKAARMISDLLEISFDTAKRMVATMGDQIAANM